MFNVSTTSDFKVAEDFEVTLLLYFIFDVNNIDVVSGSTITGLTDATLYGFKDVTIFAFVVSVNVEPDAALIAIFTTPYTGVSSSSPPQALTDIALGYILLTIVS